MKTAQTQSMEQGGAARCQFIYNNVLSHHGTDIDILDIGSKDGRKGAVVYFDRYGIDPRRLHAVDADKESLGRLRHVVREKYAVEIPTYCLNLVSGLLADVLPPITFDVVICAELLEHLRQDTEQDSVLEQAINLLCTGGSFAITFPVCAKLNKKKWGHKCKRVNQDRIESLLSGRFDVVIKEVVTIKRGAGTVLFYARGKQDA